MGDFSAHYEIEENRLTRLLHKHRRMFCIRDNRLFIAYSGLPYSHAVWFEKEGWCSEEDVSFMEATVCGFVSRQFDIYFYTGWDFSVNERVEALFFPHLRSLVEVLALPSSAQVYGGLIKEGPGEVWPPQKDYGLVADLLS